jgi:alkylhydroperoxidase/carboxymuconolactone decarboxylase family protein YurZ
MTVTGTDASQPRDGREVRAKIFGADRAYASRPITEDLAPVVKEISDQVLWGKVWADETLDLRTRSIVTITTLLAQERFDYVLIHMHGARRLGITRDELAQVAVQMLFYAGLPVVHTALKLIDKVFAAPEDELPAFPSQR